MFLLLAFAFLSGLVTVLTPCIWPLLPIILGVAGTNPDRRRPLAITAGIVTSFAVFTLATSTLVHLFHFDPNIFRTLAVVVIALLGLSLLLPAFNTLVESLISRLTSAAHPRPVGSAFTTGLVLGLLWSPCAGPILAAIAFLAATGQVTGTAVAVTLAYALGTGLPLFIFSLAGQRLFTKVRFISAHTRLVQQIFGVIMILTAFAIYSNWDLVLQSRLSSFFPALNGFETTSAVQNQLSVLLHPFPGPSLSNSRPAAPDFVGITHWLNTDHPLTLAELKGQVVLVDFWTYTCINCLRTLPHVTAWYDRYHSAGFTVIGVHTPEFEFEKNTANVEAAIRRFNIRYPVAQDNNYATWNAYQNQYWPAEYLIDATGVLRHTHFGEGDYAGTEALIRQLLSEAGHPVTSPPTDMPDLTSSSALSPETYVGADRMQHYYPSGNLPSGAQNFQLVSPPPVNTFSLGGQWQIQGEYSTAGARAVLAYNFFAQRVYLVLSPSSSGPGTLRIFLDGSLVSTQTVDSDRLYTLINLPSPGEHLLRLEFTPGINVFAFTFG